MNKLIIKEWRDILHNMLETEKRKQRKVKKLELELIEFSITGKLKNPKRFSEILEELNTIMFLDEELTKSMIKSIDETLTCNSVDGEEQMQ